MIKGMDISTLLEMEELGIRYYDKAESGYEEGNLLDILKRYGFDSIRLRLWHTPYAEDGTPYGAGNNDLDRTIIMAQKVKEKGFSLLLDIHYSDFWTDPGKQIKPKAWKDLTGEALEAAVYDYTVEVMERMKSEGVLPDMVQVGNELSNGLLWPDGHTPAYDVIRRLVNAGIRGVRKCAADIPVMLHLDNGGNNDLYREWFDHFMDGGEEFEYIGLSYYPFWHGSLQMLSDNMNDIAVRYGKKLIAAEVSRGFTMEDYASYEKLSAGERKGMATRQSLVDKIDYPMTKQGQCDFMRDFMQVIKDVPENKGCGFYYWEGAWIPVPGSGWATPASLAYMQDPGPCGNEWANQALFDYDGRVLPAMEVIRDFQ